LAEEKEVASTGKGNMGRKEKKDEPSKAGDTRKEWNLKGN